MIVGIDEVGRGPWAGPLVVGAVVLGDTTISGLTDSKKLSKRRREELSTLILERASAFGLGWVMSDELDELGLSSALKVATRRALEQITVPYHEIIIDGTVNFLADTSKGPYVTTMKKADLLIAAVSAASIIAKVARDDYMAALDERYEGYGFASHAGYGTAFHRTAILEHGLLTEHRRSFAPIAAMTGAAAETEQPRAGRRPSSGALAEDVAAKHLGMLGYDIVERNWKTKFCEIDIIAEKDDVLYFVEVKHRRAAEQGDGLAAITPRKLRQMDFAARIYMASTRRNGDAQLMAVATSGTDAITVETALRIE